MKELPVEFQALALRHADAQFVSARQAELRNRTWYLAKLAPREDAGVDASDCMPRPWKAVRVDRNQYTMFQGVLSGTTGREALDVFYSASPGQLEIGPEMEEADVLEWLREFNLIREAFRVA